MLVWGGQNGGGAAPLCRWAVRRADLEEERLIVAEPGPPAI